MRVTLTRSMIVSAGCELARRRGVQTVSVRSVASAVGVTPMAMYRHVAGAGDLQDAVLAQLCASLPAPPESIEDLRRWAPDFRAWLLGAPGLTRLVLIRWFELPAMLDIVESLLTVFDRIGLAGFELVAAANSLFSYVLARAELEEAVRASGVQRPLPWDQDDASRPLLTSLRDEYAIARLDEHFTFGLERLLRGLVDDLAKAR
jgi:AcrR family transcriptional regulator